MCPCTPDRELLQRLRDTTVRYGAVSCFPRLLEPVWATSKTNITDEKINVLIKNRRGENRKHCFALSICPRSPSYCFRVRHLLCLSPPPPPPPSFGRPLFHTWHGAACHIHHAHRLWQPINWRRLWEYRYMTVKHENRIKKMN